VDILGGTAHLEERARVDWPRDQSIGVLYVTRESHVL